MGGHGRRQSTPEMISRNFDPKMPMDAEESTGVPVRSHVSIVQIRASEIQPGDVVNRRGPERTGWIEVDRTENLPDGTLVVHDKFQQDSFTAIGYDLVWLQTLLYLNANSHLPLPG